MRRTLFALGYVGLAVLLGLVAVSPSSAQQDEVVRFNIANSGQSLYKMAIPLGLGDPQTGKLMQ